MRQIGYVLVVSALLTGCMGDRLGGDNLTITGMPAAGGSSAGGGNSGGSSTPTPSASAPGPTTTAPPASPQPTASPNTTPAGIGASPGPTPSGNLCGKAFGVCDDFETGAAGQSPDAKWWTVQTQNPQETVQIDASRAYSGHQSLHIHTTNSGYERAMIVNKSIFPAPNNTFFGRVFFYLAGDQPQTHFNLVDASGMLPGQSVPTDVVYGGQIGMFLANYYNAANPSAVLDLWQHAGVANNGTYSDTTPVPTNRWACLEWQFKGDTNEMHMWLDGSPVDSMTLIGNSPTCCATTTWTQPPFSQVALGWNIVANSEAFDHFDYWLDAVALDTNRIGCTP